MSAQFANEVKAEQCAWSEQCNTLKSEIGASESRLKQYEQSAETKMHIIRQSAINKEAEARQQFESS